MALTDHLPSPDTPILMRMVEETPDQTAATVWPRAAYRDPVPYLANGLIDWSRVDDESNSGNSTSDSSSESDFDNTLCSEVASEDMEDLDCVVFGHSRSIGPLCEKIEELPSPARKRSKESAATVSIAADAGMIVPAHPQPIVAPAADIQTVDSF